MTRRDEWLNKVLTDARLTDADVVRLTRVARWLDASEKYQRSRRRLPPARPDTAK